MKAAIMSTVRRRSQEVTEFKSPPDVDLKRNLYFRKKFTELKTHQDNILEITDYDLLNVSVVSDLHAAAYNNDKVALKALISPNIDVDAGTTGCPKLLPDLHEDTVYTTYASFFEGTSPLMMAAYRGNKEAMRRLVRAGASVDHRDCVGNTALAVAVSNSQMESCKFLRNHGADVNVEDIFGLTPLLLAVSKNNDEICSWLIKRKSKVDVFDRKGRTCLHYAAWNSNQYLISILLDHGLNPDQRDVYGATSLHYALETDHLKSQTPFDLLSAHNHRYQSGHFGIWKTITCLLNRGADPNALNMDLTSPTHKLVSNLPKISITNGIVFCADYRNNELFLVILILFLNFGADMHVEDGSGRTSMQLLKERQNAIADRLVTSWNNEIHDSSARRANNEKGTSRYYRNIDADIEKNIRKVARILLTSLK